MRASKIKKLIARELLIFFGSMLIIVLTCIFLQLQNRSKLKSAAGIATEISINENFIDSLRTKRRMFIHLIENQTINKEKDPATGSIPLVEVFDYKKDVRKALDESVAPYGFISDHQDSILTKLHDPLNLHIGPQIAVLYELLRFLQYEFAQPKTAPKAPSLTYSRFEEVIINELDYDSKEAPSLLASYNFLKSRKVVDSDFENFACSLGGGSLAKINLDQLRKLKVRNLALEQERQLMRDGVMSDDEIMNSMILLAMIVAVVIYPFRLFVLSIVWAVKTLREN